MKLTNSALAQYKKMIEESGNQSGVRFFTVQGCCSPRLQMEITPSSKEGDIVEKIGDVDFFVTPDADEILSKITIDYSDDGFRTVQTMDDSSNKKCC